MHISVFCSSSPTIDEKHIQVASDLGAGIAARNWNLVSGGGRVSCMGAVARAARAGGAKTIGVIPEALVKIEFADHDSDVLHVVKDMRERKGMIEELSDAFVVLPGGAGTLEELFEIWVGRYLKFHNKPVVILDPFGIYNPLHELVEHLEVENFIKPGMRELISWTTDVTQALKACS